LNIPNSAPVGDRTVLQPDCIKVLFSNSKTRFRKKECEDWYIHAYRFLAVVGLRPGELCELERRKQSKGKAVVHGSYNRFGEHTSGKTKNAIRTFIIPDLAVQILSDQRAMLKKAGVVSKYVFPSPDGTQSTSREIYKRWQMYQKVNNITPISLYELRHTFVSVCKENIPEALIKPVLGHSSKMPTYETYGHIINGDLEAAASLINETYSVILDKKKEGL